jgi:hypothetical protein
VAAQGDAEGGVGGTSAVTVSSEVPLSGLDVAAALDEVGDYRLAGG